ncbi:hypothetical protein PBY51_024682 [Eleginops maclovinus]|uniref:Ig-like domain-containing protein n=1 Tax=Eleginops maclovinus TaxID=56733 RepID=A0AAN7XTY0_ELEMC|nr:hypothetical protein PBY51_024682 [Eleginops maclovinus]
MEMWLKRTTLVLLTVAALVVSGKDVILQTQRTEEVPFGSSVTLLCIELKEKHERFRVNWYFNPTGPSLDKARTLPNDISNNSAKSSTVVSNKTKPNTEKNKYTIINATENDTGWYFCNFTDEIPTLTHYKTNGTKLNIMKSKEHTTYPSLSKNTVPSHGPVDVDLVGGFFFHLIVLLVVCFLLRRRNRRSRGEDPIYANTHPVPKKQPSPRPGVPVDDLKKASSTQNLRDPSPGRKHHEDRRRCKP